MSRSVRFKLNGIENKYVTDTFNMIRKAGVPVKSLSDVAKSSLMEFCVGINKRIQKAREEREANVHADTKGDTGAEQVSPDGSSDAVEDKKAIDN